MPNNQLISRALEMLTKMYSCRRANDKELNHAVDGA